MPIRSRRAYEPALPSDGRRYLIDRLWPRGVSRARLELTGWLQELAPSTQLREWYGHEPSRYRTFRSRFRAELAHHPGPIDRLAREAREGTVTLVFAARSSDRCNASVLQELVEERMGDQAPPTRTNHHVRSHRRRADPE